MTTTVSYHFSAETTKKVEQLRTHFNLDSHAKVISKALSLLDLVMQAEINSEKLILVDKIEYFMSNCECVDLRESINRL